MVDQLQHNSLSKDLAKFSKTKKSVEWLLQRWGTPKTLAVRLCLSYLDSPKDYLNILLVCKDWNTKFSDKVMKLSLSRIKEPSPRARIELYSRLLDIVISS